MKVKYWVILLFSVLSSCQSPMEEKALQLPSGQQIILLSGSPAQGLITSERGSDYFEVITLKDIAIHLKQPVSSFRSRPEAIKTLKASLAADVLPFNAEEAKILERWCLETSRQLHIINPEIIPSKIFVIKVKGNVTGRQVVFTRGQAIIIPEDLLQTQNKDTLKPALFRAFYHIISEENPDIHRALLQIFHFKPLPLPFNQIKNAKTIIDDILIDPNSTLPSHYLHLTDSSGSEVHRFISMSQTSYLHFSIDDPTFYQEHYIVYALDSLSPGNWAIRVPDPDRGGNPYTFDDIFKTLDNVQNLVGISFLPADLSVANIFASFVQEDEWITTLPEEYQEGFTKLMDQFKAVLYPATFTKPDSL